jgi:hypothetical protein
MAGCGYAALHYAGDNVVVGEPMDLSKTYSVNGEYASYTHCTSCGRALGPPDLRVDWFFPEVVH